MKLATQHETRTIAAGEFKAKCLQLMDEVQQGKLTLVITKRGKPVGRFLALPKEENPSRSFIGSASGIKILGDILSPLPQEWTLPEYAWEKSEKIAKKTKKKK